MIFLNAWADAKTWWGKAAAVLFYLWVWIVLLSSVWNAIDPHSLGSGCFLDNAADERDETLMTCMIRSYDIVVIGFLGYAHLGGARVKNIATVLAVWLANTIVMIPLMQLGQDLGCPGTGIAESK